MPNLMESDIAFIKKNFPKELSDAVFQAQEVREILNIFNTWINQIGDCWEDDGENYNDLGREAQRVYDNIYLYA